MKFEGHHTNQTGCKSGIVHLGQRQTICRILLVTPLPQNSKRGLCYRKEKGILLGIPFFDEPLYGDITLLCIGVVIADQVVLKEIFGGIPAGHLACCLVIVVGQDEPDFGAIRVIPVIGLREIHA